MAKRSQRAKTEKLPHVGVSCARRQRHGDPAGRQHDLYGRVIGEHLFRHLPGNPTINMEHMPGAGGVIAGNHIYGPGPQDGTRILLSHSIPLAETLEPKGVRLPLPSCAILLSEAREGRQ